jgi:hypothetical protein
MKVGRIYGLNIVQAANVQELADSGLSHKQVVATVGTSQALSPNAPQFSWLTE